MYMTIPSTYNRWNRSQNFLRIYFRGYNPQFGSNKIPFFLLNLIVNWIFIDSRKKVNLFSLLCRVFHCGNLQQLICLLFCWRTFGFPIFCYHKHCFYEHSYMFLRHMCKRCLKVYLGVETVGCWVCLCSFFPGNAKLFSEVVVAISASTSNVSEFWLLHIFLPISCINAL